jgi:hypothetical protein
VIDRPEATDKENFIFESAPWTELDAFPAKTKLVFKHDLGVRPFLPKSYISFTPGGISGKGSVSEAAGNEVLYDCFDSHVIVIRNDTCEENFYVKVVASGSPNGDPDDDSCGD